MRYKKLYDLINSSNRIFILSHVGPDADAVGSVLFTYSILSRNYPDKQLSINIEGHINESFSFLEGFADIQTNPVAESISAFNPELIIMLDVCEWRRATLSPDVMLEFISSGQAKTVIVDHHNMVDGDSADVYINELCSSTSEKMYEILVKDFKLEILKNDAEAAMVGILGDTARFMYRNPKHRITFEAVSDMIDLGVSIELLENKINTYNIEYMKVISELINNLGQKDDYNFSYISDEFLDGFDQNETTYRYAYHKFIDDYIRNIKPNMWGFIILPDISEKGFYKGIFRATDGSIDTTFFSKLLNGGGHKLASGFKIRADSCKGALSIVHKVIAKNKAEAYANK